METRKEAVLGAVVRGGCSEENKSKTMDVDLAKAITDEIMKLPEFAELNIETEMVRLYSDCKDERLKLDVLLQLECLKIGLAQIKKEAKPA